MLTSILGTSKPAITRMLFTGSVVIVPHGTTGLLLNGGKKCRSAQTGSWENAEQLARNLEDHVDPELETIEARQEMPARWPRLAAIPWHSGKNSRAFWSTPNWN